MLKHRWVFESTAQKLLHQSLPKKLRRYGYSNMQRGKDFFYSVGTIPIMLVAHVDTVERSAPTDIFVDKRKGVVWSPQGLGGDDRAGVAAILEILDSGLRPSVLFLDKEEVGMVGASEAIRCIKDIPDVKYIIELDRARGKEAVFYDCDNQEFINYVCSFGFEENSGTFTDITVLCPFWKIAGVNLSVGYHNQHTKYEYVVISEWQDTVNKVRAMLTELPTYVFEYREKVVEYYKTYGITPKKYKVTHNPNESWYSKYTSRWGELGESGENHSFFLDTPVKNHVVPLYSENKQDEKVVVTIDSNMLVYELGGTKQEWSLWLKENGQELKQEIEEKVLDYFLDILSERT